MSDERASLIPLPPAPPGHAVEAGLAGVDPAMLDVLQGPRLTLLWGTRSPTRASRSARAVLSSCRIVSARPGAGNPAPV